MSVHIITPEAGVFRDDTHLYHFKNTCMVFSGLFLQALQAVGFNARALPDSPAYLTALKKHFGIELGASYNDLKPLSQEK